MFLNRSEKEKWPGFADKVYTYFLDIYGIHMFKYTIVYL